MKKVFTIFLIILLIGALGICIHYAINMEDSHTTEEEKIKGDDLPSNDLPKEDEPYENETKLINKNTDDEESSEVELKYDQYIVASGYAGASDNVYYTRNKVLYHLVISTDKTTKLAEGVEKIESDLDGMRAYKSKDFKIFEEDEYVTYID